MTDDVYTDGPINIGLVHGMIRVEFAAYAFPHGQKGGAPELQPTHCLVMTPQGFLKTLGNFEAMVDKLVEAGIVQEHRKESRSGPAREDNVALTTPVADLPETKGKTKNLKVRK